MPASWNDNRGVAKFQQVVEHEEYDEHSDNLYWLLNGYERLYCHRTPTGLGPNVGNTYNNVAWTRPGVVGFWKGALVVRPNIPWGRARLAVWILAISGSGAFRLDVLDQTFAHIAYIPNAAGVTVNATGCMRETVNFLDLSTLATDYVYMLYPEGIVDNPGDSFEAYSYMVWGTSSLET